MFSAGNLIGFFFALGFLILARPAYVFMGQREIVSNFLKRVTNEPNFANQVVITLLFGGLASLIAGVFLKSSLLSVIFLSIGCLVGFKAATVKARNQEIEFDLRLRLATGSFLDLVGICTNSGLSIRQSIIESAKKNSIEMQKVWKVVSEDATAEFPFLSLLAKTADENRANVMGRVSRTLLIAQERGTPIQQTLQGLANEIRSETRRQLLEIAAKKDVSMMVPVVFGILPSITAIALYPAFISISTM